ncbi:hypothetical protein GobsT_70730 [Gemmata obscuriglobus]|uniref:Uncharacterized protein n=1 Tax=Gemmata obscuriglobus TaxID=114 RepID=A0A2Z3HFR1_9BACT|nr:hypothetical protein [Gemmata obscuriglobus]AWM41815.1 hypothetical protein C1280_35695 [Gemmata obscuriglobus]QEG32221.1 hypothetical protein GobsT_70730 [Gemmata obscuriglobus]VTS11574.1 Uncharacterized protein OS=Pirellula staleyi (strain ATCC 27377 / DSM 6068 / ICPB 4128) GN=Psta_3733 PE=4 SV=1 [Gemmata obscuriglobus UQM 2246]
MPIMFDCGCGKTLRVPDQHAGKHVKCPACNGVAAVPAAEPEPTFEIVDDTAAPPAPSPKVRGKPVPARVNDDDDDEDRRGYGVSKSRYEDDEEERPRPRKKKKKIKAARSFPRDDYDRMENTNSTSAIREIVGGVILMVIGGGLFALAWANDRISIYGIVLFVGGLIALLKGLAGGSGDA